MNWGKVCTPKKEGGLGLRSMKDMNNALLGSYGELEKILPACGKMLFLLSMVRGEMVEMLMAPCTDFQAYGKELYQSRMTLRVPSDTKLGLAIRSSSCMTFGWVIDLSQSSFLISLDVLETPKLRLAISWKEALVKSFGANF